MSKFRDIKRLKIVEQIILVLLLAVIIPTTVSAIIINNINQHAVRNELQYSALSISESIASNIETFSKSGEDELNQAIESAHLQEMIADLPQGLDTLLGERGMTLSGGQRQRVAIARAMIKNTPIVILDEATSALDNKSEAIVQKALDNLIQNKTVFVIAHRLSTIKNADRIAVINEGELVELGNHDELMSIENGQYKSLYDMQFKKQEVNV